MARPTVYEISDTKLPGNWEHLISTEERQRADRFLSKVAQTRFINQRLQLRTHLAKLTGRKPEELVFERDHQDRPYLVDADLDFNISHSGSFLAIQTSSIHKVGVDIEVHRQIRSFEAMKKKVLSPSEIDIVGNKEIEFLKIWTKKEAYLKCSGTGLRVHLPDIESSQLPVATEVYSDHILSFTLPR